MLYSVLRSPRAIKVNIEIMRVFVRIRQMLATHKELAQKLEEHVQRIAQHDNEIANIFEAIRQLMTPSANPRKKIGFKAG
jgi:Na+/phosphate symporter